MALFAHCASLTVNVVKLPWENRPHARETAETLATAVTLDMTAHWTPTTRAYLGRVTKAHILAAVREAVGDEAVGRMEGMKKQPMAAAVEAMLSDTGWLPAVLRTQGTKGRADQRDSGVAEAETPDAPAGSGLAVAAE